MKNQLLIDADASFTQKIPREIKGAYHRANDAGMKILFGKNAKGQSMLDDDGDGEFQLEEGQDPIKIAVDGAIGLIRILQEETKGKFQRDPLIYAGQSLLIDILDFMEQGGAITVDAATLDRATTLYTETLMEKLGITPEKVQAMTGEVQGVMGDRQKMAQFQSQQPPAQAAQPPTGLIGG